MKEDEPEETRQEGKTSGIIALDISLASTTHPAQSSMSAESSPPHARTQHKKTLHRNLTHQTICSGTPSTKAQEEREKRWVVDKTEGVRPVEVSLSQKKIWLIGALTCMHLISVPSQNITTSTRLGMIPIVRVVCLLGAVDRSICVDGLQDQALLLLLLPGEQGGAGGVLKDLAHAFVRLGRALEVFLRADLLADVFSLWWERSVVLCVM